MSSITLDKAKAAELISQFEQQQKSQLAILRKLHGIEDDQDVTKSDDASASKTSCKNRAGGPRRDWKRFPADFDISTLSMPAEWAPGWSDSLLKERIEERRNGPGSDNDWRRMPSAKPPSYLDSFFMANIADDKVEAKDPDEKFIENEVLQDFADFTDQRPNDKPAFYVVDSGIPIEDGSADQGCKIPSREDFEPNPLPDVTKERSITSAFRRHIIIQAFTPSAIAAVLLTAPKDPTRDSSSLYASLRRHLSTDTKDRFHYDAHCFSRTESQTDIVHVGSMSVSYFSLSPKEPAQNQSPLSPSGIFGTEGPKQQFIREQKLTFAFVKNDWRPGTSVAATFGAMMAPRSGTDQSASLWLTNNLRHIWWKWEKVLDHLDEEISLPGKVIFDKEWQKNVLWRSDRSKQAKKHFWALQTLLVFEDFINETLDKLDAILSVAYSLDGSKPSEWEEGMHKKRFAAIKERIVQRRKLVESWNNAYVSVLAITKPRETDLW